jgi:hypothetical protein
MPVPRLLALVAAISATAALSVTVSDAAQATFEKTATRVCINRRGFPYRVRPFHPKFMHVARKVKLASMFLDIVPTIDRAAMLHVSLGRVVLHEPNEIADKFVTLIFVDTPREAASVERALEDRLIGSGLDPRLDAFAAIGHRGNVAYHIEPMYFFARAEVRRELARVFACLRPA